MFFNKKPVSWFNKLLPNTPIGLLLTGIATGLGYVVGASIGQRLLEADEKPAAPRSYRERELI